MNKRILSALMSALMLIPGVMSACGGDGGGEKPEVTSEAAVTEAVTERSVVDEMTKGVSFGGRDFNIGYSVQYETNEIDFEEETGEIIDDAVFTRNRMTEEKLGININGTYIGMWTDLLKTIQTMLSAGDCPYDVFACSMWFMFLSSLNGYLYDLNTINSLDLSHDWWDKETIGFYSLGSKNLYFVSGAINYTDDISILCLAFSKPQFENMGFEAPYQTVRDGKWVFDRFFEMSAAFGADIDGDGKISDGDHFGYSDNSGVVNRVVNAAGETFIVFDDEGHASMNTSERLVNVLDKMREEFTNKSITSTLINDRGKAPNSSFANGEILFASAQVSSLFSWRKTVEFDFGVIPFPKYDEQQENYWSWFSTVAGSAFAIPVTSLTQEDTGVILDVMGYYSQETIAPAVMERSLMGKSIRDDESEDMLNLIFRSKIFELGSWGCDAYGEILGFIDNAKVMSTLEKAAPKVEKQFAPVLEYYHY